MAPSTPTGRRIAGVVGRASGQVRLAVIETASMIELDDAIDAACLAGTMVNTDEWNGYNRVGRRHRRVHRTVDHSGPKSTWAIDADGDGVRDARSILEKASLTIAGHQASSALDAEPGRGRTELNGQPTAGSDDGRWFAAPRTSRIRNDPLGPDLLCGDHGANPGGGKIMERAQASLKASSCLARL